MSIDLMLNLIVVFFSLAAVMTVIAIAVGD